MELFSTAMIIYYIVAYILMLIISNFMVYTMNKPSKITKLIGILFILFAPITLPLFILFVVILNLGL